MAKSLNEFIVVLLSAIVTEQRRVRAIFISIVEIIFFFFYAKEKRLHSLIISIILISRGKKYSYVNSFPLTQDLYLPRCNPLSKYSKNDNCDF